MKTAVFIDGANIYYHIQKHDLRINFTRLVEELLAEDDKVQGVHYFNASRKQEGLEGFFKVLSEEGIQLHIQEIPSSPGTDENDRKQKGVDVNLAVVAVASVRSFDKAIIVSGDADFKPLADYLKMLGKTVVFASFKESLSNALSEYRNVDLVEIVTRKGVSWQKKPREVEEDDG